MFGYVRGQLLFSLIMGASAALALWIFGVLGIFPDGAQYALFFGAFYGLMELIPYIGPILGPLPPVLVALFANPISALWVVLLFIALQQLEGHVVAPQVFRISLRINPILIILALLIGYQIYGIVGALRGAADGRRDPRDRALPAPPPRARAVGTDRGRAVMAAGPGPMSRLRRGRRPERRLLPLVRRVARAAGAQLPARR